MTRTLRIICICSGNICRSPMADALLNNYLKRVEIPAVVISAGTLGLQGRSAATNACQAMAQWDIDIQGHRSQGVSVGLLQLADYLIVMSPHHGEELLARDPRLGDRIVALWQYASNAEAYSEIADPVGQDLQAFIQCRDLIAECLQNWIETEFKACVGSHDEMAEKG